MGQPELVAIQIMVFTDTISVECQVPVVIAKVQPLSGLARPFTLSTATDASVWKGSPVDNELCINIGYDKVNVLKLHLVTPSSGNQKLD